MRHGTLKSLATWDAVKGYLQDKGPGWLFRGHADSSWGLQSTVERYRGDMPASAAEEMITRRFKRNAYAYLEAHQMPRDAVEWTALMQHHGAPTRLLDWTTSPYVAAFFALEEAVDPDKYCAIWAIDAEWCKEQGSEIIRAAAGDNTRLKAFSAGASTWLDEDFEEVFQKRKLRLAMPVEPFRRNERLTIQNGLFLCPGDVSAGFGGNFAGYDQSVMDRYLVKVELSNGLRREILQDLNKMNINRATLFPGLDGFAQSLKHATVLLESPQQLAEQIRRRGAGPA